jgi:hypothetical protein
MANAELACTYAALILADDDVAVTSEKISTILKAAGVDVEPYWPSLFAKVTKLYIILGCGSGFNDFVDPARILIGNPDPRARKLRKIITFLVYFI